MLVSPEIETRTEQPYAALRARVPMDGIAAFAVRTLADCIREACQ